MRREAEPGRGRLNADDEIFEEFTMLKNAIVITLATTGVICGAITGIVGGAFSIAAVSAILHLIVGG